MLRSRIGPQRIVIGICGPPGAEDDSTRTHRRVDAVGGADPDLSQMFAAVTRPVSVERTVNINTTVGVGTKVVTLPLNQRRR